MTPRGDCLRRAAGCRAALSGHDSVHRPDFGSFDTILRCNFLESAFCRDVGGGVYVRTDFLKSSACSVPDVFYLRLFRADINHFLCAQTKTVAAQSRSDGRRKKWNLTLSLMQHRFIPMNVLIRPASNSTQSFSQRLYRGAAALCLLLP